MTDKNADDKNSEKEAEEKDTSEVTMSQSAFNEKIGGARTSAREKGEAAGKAAALEAFGFDADTDPEVIKAALDAAKKQKAEDQSDVENATEALTTAQKATEKANKAAEDATTERDKIAATSTRRLIRAELLLEASKEEYGINPDALTDVWSFITAEQMDNIEVDEKTDKVKGIDKALKAVLKTRQYLVGGSKKKEQIGTRTSGSTKKLGGGDGKEVITLPQKVTRF